MPSAGFITRLQAAWLLVAEVSTDYHAVRHTGIKFQGLTVRLSRAEICKNPGAIQNVYAMS